MQCHKNSILAKQSAMCQYIPSGQSSLKIIPIDSTEQAKAKLIQGTVQQCKGLVARMEEDC